MDKTQTKKPTSFLTKIVLFIIIAATIFSIYYTIKLVYSGFTFR
ncbi:MAG TPA: hypothetical protein PK294_00480 [Ignavibacteria bacterium]|nr:hypothetical protein [Ignavibacteria bacterium]HRA98885.1 hypothetical protein [Ignavibacteria bacterium]